MRPATPSRPSNKPIRRLALASALALCLPVAIGVCAEMGGAAAMAGPWEIALHDTPRKCGLVLRPEKTDAADLTVALPAGCRRAMPVLVDVGGWSASNDSEVLLDDRVGSRSTLISSTSLRTGTNLDSLSTILHASMVSLFSCRGEVVGWLWWLGVPGTGVIYGTLI